MASEYDRHLAIIVVLQAGLASGEIISPLKLPKLTVYDIAGRFKASEGFEEGSGTAARSPPDRSATKKWTREFLDNLQSLIDDNPGISMMNLAIRLGVSKFCIRTAVHEDLRCKSYVFEVWQMLSEMMKVKRVEKCQLLLTSLKHSGAVRLCFFLIRKFFVWMHRSTGEMTDGSARIQKMF